MKLNVHKLQKDRTAKLNTKGLSTLDTQCALNRMKFSLSVSTLNAHSPNPNLIQINPNPLPEVVSIQIDLDHAIAHCMCVKTKKGMACILVC